jgi:hypothetical protein
MTAPSQSQILAGDAARMSVDRKEPNQPIAIRAHMARRPRIHHNGLQSRRYRNSTCFIFLNL